MQALDYMLRLDMKVDKGWIAIPPGRTPPGLAWYDKKQIDNANLTYE